MPYWDLFLDAKNKKRLSHFHLYSQGGSSICRACLYVASVPAVLEENQMQRLTSETEATATVSTCVIWIDVSI